MRKFSRRQVAEALAAIPAKHQAWLRTNDVELFAYYGWGVVLNSAQLEDIQALLDWPAGTVHVWRWANRTGKTTGLFIAETFYAWKKWGWQADWEDALGFLYKVLHAAPLGSLAGKAVTLAEGMVAGNDRAQQNPITLRQREGILRPFFEVAKEVDATGSPSPVLRCATGGKVDYKSTQGGAGRLESDQWHLFVWDEFPRQAPMDDIEIIFDQTILPRTSDFMASVVLSGTATEDTDHVYVELEDYANDRPGDFHFTERDRGQNFAQSQASIDRQLRLTMNKEAAQRSVYGRAGVRGRGKLFPEFLLANAFRDDLPDTTPLPTDPAERSLRLATHGMFSSFDHALKGDQNVTMTAETPWPPALVTVANPITLVHRGILDPSRTLTADEQVAYCANEVRLYSSRAMIIDSTGEGGLAVYRQARLVGLPAIDCQFAARMVRFVSNKEYGLQALQQLLAWGMSVPQDAMIEEWPQPDGPFGVLRIPKAWTTLRRQLSVLRRDDAGMKQDEAMALLMLAWYLFPLIPRGDAKAQGPQHFNIMARRRTRGLRAGRRYLR